MYTNNKPIADALAQKKVLVAAHRGTCGGNIVWNTSLSYKNALLHGADMIEIDVSMTKDGVFFAFHNTEEEAEFGRKCDIREMTSQEVEEINVLNAIRNTSGQKVERLEEVLPKFRGKCLINIDRSWLYPFLSLRSGTKRYENIFPELIFLYNSSCRELGILQITGR